MSDQLIGRRLRWTRETMEPSIEKLLTVMQTETDPKRWRAYEAGEVPLPHDVAEEFAHRFYVTTEFLYQGRTDGVHPLVLQELLKAHPEVRPH